MKLEGRPATRGPKFVWFENDFLAKLALLLVFYVEQG
jgi:hypothetical protein